MRTGVVTALAAEADALRGIGNGASADFTIAVAGPGLANAKRAAEHLLATGAERLFVFGIAGGLVPTYDSGQVIIYDAIFDASGGRYECDHKWCRALAAQLHRQHPAIVAGYSAASPLRDAATKRAIAKRHGCAAVDMESAAVVQAAHAAGVPAAVVRAILDPLDFTLPQASLGGLSADGRTRSSPVLLGLLRRPWELPAVLALARRYGIARRVLRHTAQALVPHFGES